MIAFLQGKPVSKGSDYIIISVGGVGYKVFVPATTMARFSGSEEEVKVHTYLHVREDALILFGFAEEEELQLFETLINVNGVGPKVALGILSSGSANALKQAIVGENLVVLTNIPGIGKKTAQRIIIELKDKLAKEPMLASNLGVPGIIVSSGSWGQEAIEALQALGYSQAEASRAVQGILAREDSSLKIEEVIRLALKELARI